MTETAREALIVAVSEYRDPKLRQLRAPAADAEALERVLRDPSIGDFRVKLAVNKAEGPLRRQVARFLADRRPTDLLLVHFSCHGIKDASGELYLAATDTDTNLLCATGLPSGWLNEQIGSCRSRRIVVLLDCCFSGSFPFGMHPRAWQQVNVQEHLQGRGRVVITASNALEYAFEGDELSGGGQPSIFTAAVVHALETGEADRDGDHRISVDELYEYVFDRVRDATPNQTPTKLSNVEGPLFIARSSYEAPIEPAPLPPELVALLEHPMPDARLAGIDVLSRLLTAGNAGLALSARQAIDRLCTDDSRRVSERASGALRGDGQSMDTNDQAPRDAPPASGVGKSEPAGAASPRLEPQPAPSEYDPMVDPRIRTRADAPSSARPATTEKVTPDQAPSQQHVSTEHGAGPRGRRTAPPSWRHRIRYRWLALAGAAAGAATVAAIIATTSSTSTNGAAGQAFGSVDRPVPTNRVTGHGTATIELSGNVATVTLETHGLLDAPHFMHIHGGTGDCPAASAAQKVNGYTFISAKGGIRSYGQVVASLTTHDETGPAYNLDSRLYPSSGNIRYRRTVTLDRGVAEQIRQGLAVIVVHGIDYNRNGFYDNSLGPNGEASAPALCGALFPNHAVASTSAGSHAIYVASLKAESGLVNRPPRGSLFLCHIRDYRPRSVMALDNRRRNGVMMATNRPA